MYAGDMWLRASLALWERRLRYRRRRREHWKRKRTNKRKTYKWTKLAREAEAQVSRRRKQLKRAKAAAARKRSRPKKFIRWCEAQVGTTEHPPGSNRGKKIDKWERQFDMLGQPYCGAGVGYGLLHVGGVKVTNRVVYVPYIVEDARHGRNGFEKVVGRHEIREGDLVICNFDGGQPDHVEAAKGKPSGGKVRTVGFNTSKDNAGSQANGGGVWNKTRDLSVVQCGVRPRYPK